MNGLISLRVLKVATLEINYNLFCRPIAGVDSGMRVVVKSLSSLELNWMALVLTAIVLGFSIGT